MQASLKETVGCSRLLGGYVISAWAGGEGGKCTCPQYSAGRPALCRSRAAPVAMWRRVRAAFRCQVRTAGGLQGGLTVLPAFLWRCAGISHTPTARSGLFNHASRASSVERRARMMSDFAPPRVAAADPRCRSISRSRAAAALFRATATRVPMDGRARERHAK